MTRFELIKGVLNMERKFEIKHFSINKFEFLMMLIILNYKLNKSKVIKLKYTHKSKIIYGIHKL